MMPEEKDDNPGQIDRVRADRGLTRRSGFMARRVRELAQKDGELKVADDVEVVFPDKELEAAVREELEKPEEPLTTYDLKSLTYLNAGERNIEDLSGLQHATNLTELWLGGNQISDLSPLASLTHLTRLRLEGNPLDQESIDIHVPNLRARGVTLH